MTYLNLCKATLNCKYNLFQVFFNFSIVLNSTKVREHLRLYLPVHNFCQRQNCSPMATLHTDNGNSFFDQVVGFLIAYMDRATLLLQFKRKPAATSPTPPTTKMTIELLHTIDYFLVLVYHSVHPKLLAT